METVKSFIGKEVHVLLANKSGAGISISDQMAFRRSVINGMIYVQGKLVQYDGTFFVLENATMKYVPQYATNIGTKAEVDAFSYSQILINKDNVVTISII